MACWPVWAALALAALIELVLTLADHGLVGSPRWRALAYGYGAFWPGLWTGWSVNYPGQSWGMMLSYGLLHAGPGHLAGNALVIALIAPDLARALGRRPAPRLAGLWLVTQLGGCIGFGLLHGGAQPMVGASGVAFGLVMAQQLARARQDRLLGLEAGARRRILATFALLMLANAASWLMLAGQLAWETHLGGTLGGILGWWLLAPDPPNPGAGPRHGATAPDRGPGPKP
ncbi:rhomboid family intramembrane serine protease [Frigidibacter sp. MR17.24]|uniref:rhomboid family intramembrane serine protease n=1 Tax=Frigidibacter sp. MR17.24 TaxID=3127345 RepID=UPI003012D063